MRKSLTNPRTPWIISLILGIIIALFTFNATKKSQDGEPLRRDYQYVTPTLEQVSPFAWIPSAEREREMYTRMVRFNNDPAQCYMEVRRGHSREDGIAYAGPFDCNTAPKSPREVVESGQGPTVSPGGFVTW